MALRFRTLDFKVPVSLVLLFLSNPLHARAFSPELHLGAEAQVYRNTVTPSFFPILNFGINAESSQDPGNPVQATSEYKFQADFRISPTHPKAFAITGPNLYYGDQLQDTFLRFAVGRKLMGWSKLDEMWGLGEFEPLNSWDRLRSSPQGLTGLFAYTETDIVNLRFFASYLYLPEFTPNNVIENNHFVLEHPQAISTAPQTFTLLNRPTPLGYELAIPSIDKIILRPSVAFSIESKRENPIYAKFSYGYLPLNYFPIALQAALAIPIDTIIVELRPRLIQHHLYNAEVTYNISESVTSGLVLMVNDPISDQIPLDYTTTPLSTSYSASPWVQVELPQVKIVLTHLRTWKGLEADVGENANPQTSIFSSRVLYRNASQLKLRYLLSPKRLHYIEAKYLHEYSINADWLAADLIIYLKSNLSFLIGGDVINAERTVSGERGAEFLADVRALDRIRVGVQYVF